MFLGLELVAYHFGSIGNLHPVQGQIYEMVG